MWREINIEDSVYMSGCVVTMDKAEFILYDCNECWKTMHSVDQMMETVKKLNKRIRFDVATVIDTLQNEQPVIVTWAKADDKQIARNDKVSLEGNTAVVAGRLLKLKYRAGAFPFHYEWHLEKLPASETVTLPAAQVFSLVETLPAQVDELLEVLRRKEEEIAQYKREHGTLTRSTLATKAFDLQQFKERFAEFSTKAKGLAHMLEYSQAKCTNLALFDKTSSGSSANSSPTKNIKLEDGKKRSPSSIQAAVKESPRSRKRKALMGQKLRLSRQMKANKRKIEYECSQSQSLSDSQEQGTIKSEEKNETNNVKELENKSEIAETYLEPERKRRISPRLQLKFCATQKQDGNQILKTGAKKRWEVVIMKTAVESTNTLNPIESNNSMANKLTDNKQKRTTTYSYDRSNVANNIETKTSAETTNELDLYVDSVLKAMADYDKQMQEDLWNEVQ